MRRRQPTTPGYVVRFTFLNQLEELERLIQTTRGLQLYTREEKEAQREVLVSARTLLNRLPEGDKIPKDEYAPLRRLVHYHSALAWTRASKRKDDGATMTTLMHRGCPGELTGIGQAVQQAHLVRLARLEASRPDALRRRLQGLPPYAANTNKEQP